MIIMMDSAFALSAGIVFLALVFLFYALNITYYKFKHRQFDSQFAYNIALIILIVVIMFSRTVYMARKYPWMDYNSIISEMLYLPFTLSFTALAMLILVKTIIGDSYPKTWRIFAIISAIIAGMCYALL